MKSASTQKFDEHCDAVIVGSGAAALAAACRLSDLGAHVILLEKTGHIGGNSAMSGGGIWVPNNALIGSVGIEDNDEDAFAYLRHVIPEEQVPDDMIRTYIQSAPEMIEYLRGIGVAYTPVAHYPDYYPSAPGWRPGGRTMDCAPLDGRTLGKDLYRLREMPPASKAFGRINLSITEASKVQAVAQGWQMIAAKALLQYALDIVGRFRGKRDRRLCMGEALVGRLLLAAQERGIEIRTNAPVQALVSEKGRICGVAVDSAGTVRKIAANRGVLVASGGFEADQELRSESLAKPTQAQWSAGSPGNSGDMIRAGRSIGAQTDLMQEAWWAPVVLWGDRPVVLFFEKSKPGMMIVDRHGRRFMNEAITYNSYGKSIYGEDYSREDRVPAFIIFDRTYRQKYMFGGLLQSSMSPDWLTPSAFGEDGLLQKAPSLRELACKLGIDPAGMAESADKMAEYAQTGIDTEFGRGSDAHDRMYGDERVFPNPCLGPLAKAPFYGARLYPGDIGTKGGLKIDQDSSVLDTSGTPISGLFAAGNCTASIMGEKYPGAGCTLGPALTMAFRGANALMQSNSHLNQRTNQRL
ncbi:FAD-dependent oxidoreductase [Parasphingorhabdus sp.]|uniref:FAD-dependent oxidoreductase n=1 Tax=Parasphingorhabdus sp. TaxID=2709688 RepID=UPI002B2659D9|nr:FAD-dependent oxidoreductase [Parasphingorhabdus sp.]